MIPVENRLKKRWLLRKIMRSGKTLHGKYIVLSYLPNKGEIPQIGFIASKKVGNAVMRNRGVRLMRESVRIFLKDGQMPNAYNYVFIARRGIAGRGMKDIYAETGQLLSKTPALS